MARSPGCCAGGLAQEALDDAILEAVEADHRQPSARPEQPLGAAQRLLELVELAVDVDTDRLEAAGRRVLGSRALVRVRAVTERLAYDLGELAGGR